jgi:hypothetical protein
MASYAADFAGLNCSDKMVITSAAEFAVGSINRAQNWAANSGEWDKLRAVFKPFLGTMRQNFEDDFHEALSEQLTGQQRAVKAELCALMPSLQFYLEAPCHHPAHIVGPHETTLDETDTKSRKDLNENYTSKPSNENTQSIAISCGADGANAEKRLKQQGPRPQTIAAAKRIGAV